MKRVERSTKSFGLLKIFALLRNDVYVSRMRALSSSTARARAKGMESCALPLACSATSFVFARLFLTGGEMVQLRSS